MLRLISLSSVLFAAAPLLHAELVLKEFRPSGGDVCTDTPLRLSFDAPAIVEGGGFALEVVRDRDGVVVASVSSGSVVPAGTFGSAGSAALHLDGWSAEVRLPARALGPGESYTVRGGPSLFRDFPGIRNEWKFSTKAALPRDPDRLTVAADGSGDFCTIQGAVDQVSPHGTRPVAISIRNGVYRELIRIGREKRFIHLVGEDRKRTVIACTNNDKLNPGWIQRSVLGVEADDFSLENLTVRNTTPYKGSQAEAVSLNAERCVLKNADFVSTQDTLHLSGSVRVSDCFIEGDVDYIWGYGSALFERCELRSSHDGYIVQARNPPGKAGYVFVDCKFTAAPETKRSWLARIETGRFPASHVAFIRCQMGPHIPAAGWLVTGPDSPTLRFVEAGSTDEAGRPLDVSQRLSASRQLGPAEVAAEEDPAKILSR